MNNLKSAIIAALPLGLMPRASGSESPVQADNRTN